MPVKIIIAQQNETLRSIAALHHCDVQLLLAANPHISDQDSNITKSKVYIPSSPTKAEKGLYQF